MTCVSCLEDDNECMVYVSYIVAVNSNRFIEKNNNFARVSCYLYISLSFLHDYCVKIPNFTFYGEREQGTQFLFTF